MSLAQLEALLNFYSEVKQLLARIVDGWGTACAPHFFFGAPPRPDQSSRCYLTTRGPPPLCYPQPQLLNFFWNSRGLISLSHARIDSRRVFLKTMCVFQLRSMAISSARRPLGRPRPRREGWLHDPLPWQPSASLVGGVASAGRLPLRTAHHPTRSWALCP